MRYTKPQLDLLMRYEGELLRAEYFLQDEVPIDIRKVRIVDLGKICRLNLKTRKVIWNLYGW